MQLSARIAQLYKDERVHALIKYSTLLKLMNMLLLQVQKKLTNQRLYAFPFRLTIEPTDKCNLKCVHCKTGQGQIGRKKGKMTFDTFRGIIDKLKKYTYLVDLYNWGEPLLNRDIYKMIRYAEDANICTSIHSNFNVKFSAENAEEMVKSGLSFLSLSLDGADQEVYEMYRKSGNFDKAISNLKTLVNKKRELNSKKPYITWQFLVFPHNRHQIEQAKKMAKELGVDVFKYHRGFSSTEIFDYSTNGDKDIPKRKDITMPKCDWLWTNATFRWDGKIASCIFQYFEKEDFGKLSATDFKATWNNEKFRYARSLFKRNIDNVPIRDDITCTRCFKVKPKLESRP